MNTVNLGRIIPVYVGNWNDTTNYIYYDAIWHLPSGALYICLVANTNTIPSEHPTKWNKVLDLSAFLNELSAQELSRQDVEALRVLAEQARVQAEGLRVQAEQDRNSSYSEAESTRNASYINSENERNASFNQNEQTRQSQENTRQTQEAARQATIAGLNASFAAKIDKTSITDEMGEDKTKVMSQYGVSDAIMKTHEYDRNYYAYGVRLDLNGTGQALERVGNLSLHKTLPIQSKMRGCLLNANGTVNYYLSADSDLFKEDGVTPSVLDGTDGDVMVEIPAFYCLEEDILNYSYSWISEFPLPDFKYIPKTYVARYEASVNRASGQVRSIINNTTTYRGGNNTSAWDGTYRSLLGIPATSIPRSTFRTGARNGRDVNWNILTTFNEFIVELLFKIEYATYNSQATYNSALTIEGYRQGGLGVGVTNLNGTLWGTFNSYNPFIPCGYSAALGNNTGFVNYTMPVEYGTLTVQVNRYRGIEMPFGHIWKIRDGFIIEMSENYTQSKYYIYDNPAHYADTKTANARLFCSLPVDEGYVKIKNKYTTMPISVGGSSSAWGCDYFYTRGEAGGLLRGVFVGGCANDGANAGLGCSYANDSPAYAGTGIGARLGYNPEIINL